MKSLLLPVCMRIFGMKKKAAGRPFALLCTVTLRPNENVCVSNTCLPADTLSVRKIGILCTMPECLVGYDSRENQSQRQRHYDHQSGYKPRCGEGQ